MLLAFAMVFIVKTDPVEAKSFDRPTLELAVDEGFTPVYSVEIVELDALTVVANAPELIEYTFSLEVAARAIYDVGKPDTRGSQAKYKLSKRLELEATNEPKQASKYNIDQLYNQNYRYLKGDIYRLGGVASSSGGTRITNFTNKHLGFKEYSPTFSTS